MPKVKILHTSDWHLGKKLFKTPRYEEQQLFLDWVFNQVQSKQIDILLIAGDIFDIPAPSNKAQKLYFDFIYKLGSVKDLQTIIIGGNHDSNSLLNLPKEFFANFGITIHTGLLEKLEDHNIYIEKRGIKIGIKTLPYFRNFEIFNKTSNKAIDDDQKIQSFFHDFFTRWNDKQDLDYKVLVSHHGFGKYSMAGSEHLITLSGLDHFPLEWVKPHFDYVALGHIHKKMVLSDDPYIIYPGSPIPLRFNENNHKHISYLEITDENLNQEFIEVPVFRKLIPIELNLENYKEKIQEIIESEKEAKLKTFLDITMLLDSPMTGLSDTIREMIKDHNIELLSYTPSYQKDLNLTLYNEDVNKLSLDELFQKYYKQKFDTDDIPDEILKSFHQLVQEVQNENP